jgi:hypothetical protein
VVLDHRLARHAQQVRVRRIDRQQLVERERLGVLDRLDRAAGRDRAEQPERRLGEELAVEDLDGPGPLRELLDIKLFVDTDADIRVLRRLRRDLEQRGRTFQSTREQYYKTVRPMHLQFVEPSKRWADLIIPEGGENHVALDLVIGRLHHYLNGQLRYEPARQGEDKLAQA